jgi:hypothetical protein
MASDARQANDWRLGNRRAGHFLNRPAKLGRQTLSHEGNPQHCHPEHREGPMELSAAPVLPANCARSFASLRMTKSAESSWSFVG